MEKSIYQRLFECWPDPRFLIERDAEGWFRVITANEKGCEYFSQGIGALDGKLLDPFLEAANKQHITKSFSVVFETGMPMQLQVIPTLPGGVRIRTFFLNPLKVDGRVIAIDMTARLVGSDEDALRRERDDAVSIFATIFDASEIGILVTDHNQRIVRVNNTLCQLHGWQPVELVGQDFTMLIPAEGHAAARKRHDDLMNGVPVQKTRELEVLKKDGTRANIIATSGVIELSGKRKFRITTLVDISTLKKIENDLRQAKEIADAANQAKSSFLANMSHELRTPLNAIIGFSDLMIAGTLGPVENAHYREYLGDIKFSALHLLDIINDVLDMSKIEAGQMKLDRQRTEIEPLLDEVARLMRTRATQAGVMLKTDITPSLPTITVDQRMLRQVLLNLVSNAIKFSNGRGSITLRATLKGEGLMAVSVTDQGIGIPADKLETVMKPFGQVQDPRINGGQGTGLGLPIARTMVELHGGQLTIASEMDVGTTVTFTLPTT